MIYQDLTQKEKTAFNDFEQIIIKLNQKEFKNIIKLIILKWLK